MYCLRDRRWDCTLLYFINLCDTVVGSAEMGFNRTTTSNSDISQLQASLVNHVLQTLK